MQACIEKGAAKIKDPVFFQHAVLGIMPHGKQKEVLRSQCKHKIIRAGRRSGKTKMIGGEIIRGAFFDIFHAQIVIAPTYKQAKIVFSEILSDLYNCGWHDIIKRVVESPYPKITFTTGAFVDFASTDNDTTLRGFHYDRIFIDEAAFIPERAWMTIRPLGFDSGAPIWMTSTPLGQNRFWEAYCSGEEGKGGMGSFSFNTFDNPHINKDAVMAEIEEHGEESVYVQTEIYGNFVMTIDKYFNPEVIKECVEEYAFDTEATI